LFGWFLGSPLAFLIEQTIDFGLYLKWRELNYEQAAVHQLKMALSHPPMLASILFSVIVFAPITEEFLFRYVAQNYLKKYLKPRYAILITGLCFALLHLLPSQGVGNIYLTASLWTLGVFLGWVYERR
jgi:membrane protease YdiL (CAAX protease family)